jgi:hypothetical protein
MKNYRRSFIVAAVALSLCAFSATSVFAQSAPPKTDKPAAKKPASLDDELFEDLDLGPKSKSKPKSTPGDKADAAKPADAATQPKVEPTKSGGDEKPAEMQQPAKRSALDEELLRQLGGEEEQQKKKPPPQGPARGGPDKSEDKASDNPLVRLSRQIRDAERRLREADSGEQTQEMQRKIVDDLEKLIAQIEQQQQQQQQSKSSKPGPPQPGEKKPSPQQKQQKQPGDPNDKPSDSNEQLANRKNEKPQTGRLKDMLEKVWGELPERQRQDVMQASFDDFPAKYQYVIEEYFKQLLKRQE